MNGRSIGRLVLSMLGWALSLPETKHEDTANKFRLVLGDSPIAMYSIDKRHII